MPLGVELVLRHVALALRMTGVEVFETPPYPLFTLEVPLEAVFLQRVPELRSLGLLCSCLDRGQSRLFRAWDDGLL